MSYDPTTTGSGPRPTAGANPVGTPPAERQATPGDVYAGLLEAARVPDREHDAIVALAAAVRLVNRAVVGSTAPVDALDRATALAETLLAELAPHAQPSRLPPDAPPGFAPTFVNHPMIGPANPGSPPISMRRDGDRVIGEVTYSTAQEGPPACVYGGYIAAGFDAILLMTAGVNGVGGPTKSLTVRYRRPTPLHTPLRYEAEVTEVTDSVTRISGRLMNGDEVCAEGSAEVARGRYLRR